MESIKESFINPSGIRGNVDVAVLFLFFTRTSITKRTFEQIRKARPTRLYLFQDGPRTNRSDDVENIARCREAVESMIDWQCEVHKYYQNKNLGCDPSEYVSQKWMFETEDKGIIIEDDDVMAVSFFPFCKELLDKYENDQRVNIICGMNHLGIYKDCPYDYFFTRNGGAIWGWATWKRVIDKWDSNYYFLKDPYAMQNLSSEFGERTVKNFISTCKNHIASGREHYESILGSYCMLNFGVNIVPKYNMTCNIGIGKDTTHSVSDISKLPRAVRKMLYMNIYEYKFPLKHPCRIQVDNKYWEMALEIINGGWPVRIFKTRKLEAIIYRLFPFLGR